MPHLSNTPNRNTLNQRASRARKQEYITSLEHKIREYEQRGITATSEVQNAARQVADENRMLKDELTVLREHVKCLEDALNRHGFVGVVGDTGDVERVSSSSGETAWESTRFKYESRGGDVEMGGQDREDRSENGTEKESDRKSKREYHGSRLTLAVSHDGNTNAKRVLQDSLNSATLQYPSPPDEDHYSGSEKGRSKRRKHSLTIHPSFDEQEAASILLSTASTPITYTHEDGPIANSLPLSVLATASASTSKPASTSSISSSSQHNPHRQYETYPHSRQSHVNERRPEDDHQPDHHRSWHQQKDHHRYEQQHQHQHQHQNKSALRTHSPNSTPCEEAALIIASMRGFAPSESDQNEILRDLGCPPRKPCKVDNVSLFGIMGRESLR